LFRGRRYARGVEKQHRQLALAHNVEHEGLAEGLFNTLLLERGHPEVRSESWATSARTLPELGSIHFRKTGDGSELAVAESDGVLLQVAVGGGRAWLTAAAAGRAAIDELIARLRDQLPAPDPSSAHEVTVTFWTYGPQGPMPSWRSIAVPSWEEIAGNYSSTTKSGLERLMGGFQPAHGGQLILWHGVAGTGKTFGLRALAWEWKDWCDFHYIVDPDAFFGEHANYLMSVLLQPEYMNFSMPSPHGFISGPVLRIEGDSDIEREDDDEHGGAKPWRVLILEDTGELLAADARMTAGQGLSRFLNVVDGLIGQGLRVLVLVTTNEPLRKLHPAVARPGRCAANVEFVQLTKDEARRWLSDHQLDPASAEPATLASLYARLEGRDPADLNAAVGFGDA
jgi:Domain of unknown function (DUF5925)/ATPase family associated with various cellular activities (AAA)